LWIKPQTGDLRGSTLTSIASVDKEVINHAWAGNDYGTNGPVSGFTNNVAIGTLVLSAQNPHTNNYLLEPLFHFYGAGVSSNAMYVNTLDLRQLTTNATDVANMIQIDPGMKIYFNAVKLGFTPTNTPAQFMEGQFPGQVYAVPAVADPFSLQPPTKNSAGQMAFFARWPGGTNLCSSIFHGPRSLGGLQHQHAFQQFLPLSDPHDQRGKNVLPWSYQVPVTFRAIRIFNNRQRETGAKPAPGFHVSRRWKGEGCQNHCDGMFHHGFSRFSQRDEAV